MTVTIDGVKQKEHEISLIDDNKDHNVEVIIFVGLI
jgi:hypothetical protein